MQAGAMIKVQAVLELARKRKDFFLVLRDDTAGALRTSGLDLSIGEQQAVVDVVLGREESPYAARLAKLRSFWSDIGQDMKARFGGEADFNLKHVASNGWTP